MRRFWVRFRAKTMSSWVRSGDIHVSLCPVGRHGREEVFAPRLRGHAEFSATLSCGGSLLAADRQQADTDARLLEHDDAAAPQRLLEP